MGETVRHARPARTMGSMHRALNGEHLHFFRTPGESAVESGPGLS